MPHRFLSALALCAVIAYVLVGCGGDDASGPQAQPDEISEAPAPSGGPTTVARVIDGDSVELDVDGEIVEARLVGINAPELGDCQGPGARDALTGIAGGQVVDVNDYGDDRYGRLLVELTINDDSINLAMIRSGWALGQHSDDHPAADLWVDAMVDAANDGLGMWNLQEECPAAGAAIRITAAEPDPPGPDDAVLEDEWIEVTNEDDVTVDLEGWSLRDESTSNRLVLPSAVLEPGATLRVHTGCGQHTRTDLFWCSDFGVWSNQGETALLLGPSGSIEDWTILEAE